MGDMLSTLDAETSPNSVAADELITDRLPADRFSSDCSKSNRATRLLFSFPHAIGRGGSINNVASNQIRGAIQLGIDVTVFCTSVDGGLLRGARVHQTMRFAGARIPHRAVGIKRAYSYHDQRVSRWLERHRDEIDIVHAYPAGCLETLKTARKLGIPAMREAPSPHTASAFHEAGRAATAVGMTLPSNHSHFMNHDRLRLEEAEYEAAGAILAPSEYAATTFLERGYDKIKIKQHRLGIELEQFPVAQRGVPTPEKGLRAIFLGRGEPNKGLHLALRAWMQSGAGERGVFSICGPPILPDYRQFLGSLLKMRGVEELGYVDDIAAEMGRSDILIHPSFTEGSAMATFEAQAVGCVALVSRSSGADTTHMINGLVHETENIEELSSHIKMLDQDRALLSRLRQASLNRRAELGHAFAAEKLVAIYQEFASSSSRPSRPSRP